jgi:hypothetical protein
VLIIHAACRAVERTAGDLEQGSVEQERRAALDARAVGAQLTVAVGTGRRLREALTRARGAIQNQQFD